MQSGSLMEIWKSGIKMPFIVKHPHSSQTVVIHRYYWPGKFFEGELLGVSVSLTAEWSLWQFVREA